jgi:hypothetical protein
MHTEPQFSFIRSLRNVIKSGTLLDEDLILSNQVFDRIRSTEALRSLRGAGVSAGARSFFCPLSFRGRALSTAPGSGQGIVDHSYFQFSDLLSYSTAIGQGAAVINDATGNAHLGIVSTLPNPSWVAEDAPAPDTDATFALRYREFPIRRRRRGNAKETKSPVRQVASKWGR